MRAARRIAALLLAACCLTLCGCKAKPATTHGFAMDTAITLTLYGDGANAADLLKEITALENQLSWNVEGSAVARLNQGERVENALLAEAVGKLLPICEATGGEYSLLMRPLCELWDVTGEEPVVPDQDEIAERLLLCKGRVEVDGDELFLPDGSKMDLGSVGKGLACDVLYDIMLKKGAVGVLSVGGSIVACGEKPSGEKWKVAVADPDDRNRTKGILSLSQGEFVSTSGNSERYFEADGKRYHHILSGTTGYPCETGLDSVTVVCGEGLIADALSTACFLLGEEKSLPLLKAYGAQAVFIRSDGSYSVTDGLREKYEVAK